MNYCIIHRRFILLHELQQGPNTKKNRQKNYIRMTKNLHVIPLQKIYNCRTGFRFIRAIVSLTCNKVTLLLLPYHMKIITNKWLVSSNKQHNNFSIWKKNMQYANLHNINFCKIQLCVLQLPYHLNSHHHNYRMAQLDETPTTSDFFCRDGVAEISYAAMICPDVSLLLPIT